MALDLDSVNWLSTPPSVEGEPEHLNCFQRTIIPYCSLLGIDEVTAKNMGTYFGGGMRMQGTCGPVNAVSILLGALYKNDAEKQDEGIRFLKAYAEANGSWLCSDIMDEEHVHCDRAIEFAKAYIEELINKEKS